MVNMSGSELEAVFGGMRWQDFRSSENVEDRRNEPNPWTPTEDGRVVGPNGEWQWDPSINANQPPVSYTPTEDGYIHGSDGTIRPDDSINATIHAQENEDALRASPEYQETSNYVSDALGGHLTPTEDGKMVGSNGHVYDDPTINANQPQEQPTPQAGEYVGEGDPYPEEQNDAPDNQGGYDDSSSGSSGSEE